MLLTIMGIAVWAAHRDPLAISALFFAIAAILRAVPKIMEERARISTRSSGTTPSRPTTRCNRPRPRFGATGRPAVRDARIPDMAESGETDAALQMRASDADRERVAEQLREAAGHGRLTMDELEERLESAYGAKTYAELEPLTRDLPTAGATPPLPAGVTGPAASLVGGTPTGRRWSVAIMSGSTRRGRWVVPGRYNAFAFWGGVLLDLREATFAEHETVIRANAIMAGIDVLVPEGVDLRVEGFGLMGGYEDATSGQLEAPPAGAPIVRVVGVAFWAGVTGRRKAPKPPKAPKAVGKNDQRGELTS